MEFGWINFLGLIIIVLIMIPNIIFAIKTDVTNEKKRFPGSLIICETIGRLCCIVFMIVPVGMEEFSFRSVSEFVIYILGNIFLVCAYYVFWILYVKNRNMNHAMALAIIPIIIFCLSGILLRHFCLIIMAVVFGAGHIVITYQSHRD